MSSLLGKKNRVHWYFPGSKHMLKGRFDRKIEMRGFIFKACLLSLYSLYPTHMHYQGTPRPPCPGGGAVGTPGNTGEEGAWSLALGAKYTVMYVPKG